MAKEWTLCFSWNCRGTCVGLPILPRSSSRELSNFDDTLLNTPDGRMAKFYTEVYPDQLLRRTIGKIGHAIISSDSVIAYTLKYKTK